MKRKRPRDPATPGQWQEAVDGAHAALVLDSSRQYGLITGGPSVNVERAAVILERGERRGYKPSADALERFVLAWNASQRDAG